MPSITLNYTNQQGLRLLTAITNSGFARLDNETDIQYVTRWIRNDATQIVLRSERDAANNGVSSDPNILT